MIHFKGGDQWNFGIYQKKFLRPIQIIFKKITTFFEIVILIFTPK